MDLAAVFVLASYAAKPAPQAPGRCISELMEFMMKTRLMLPLLLAATAFALPASANWFHNPQLGINLNVGSAPNPTPADLRQMRQPIITEDEANPAPTTTAQTPSANTTATNSGPKPAAPAQSGADGAVASAAPAR
jgi:hypothetical protein